MSNGGWIFKKLDMSVTSLEVTNSIVCQLFESPKLEQYSAVKCEALKTMRERSTWKT
jgi:hypothetical protein